MRIGTKESINEKKKSNIKILDLLVLSIILVASMIASAVVGAYYLDKDDVMYHANNISAFFSSIFYQEIKYESFLSQESEIETLVLDIPFDSMQTLLDKRQEAIQMGILLTEDGDLVNGKATFENQGPYNIELRLKGDWVDHIAVGKWSYRIKVKGDNTILGMRSFSIMDPSRRNYINEWGYHQNLISEDVLTTRYEFVNVIENGEKKGIFALEENFYTELIESQEERQGVILCFDEDTLWINRANYMENGIQMLTDGESQGLFMRTVNEQAPIKVFQSNSVYSDPVLRAEAETAVSLLQSYIDGTSSAAEVFDVGKFGTMLAITDLWGANHATYWHNLRYYYNPVTSLIEPIAYDGNSLLGEPSALATILTDQTFFDDADLRTAYITALERVTRQEYILQVKNDLHVSMDRYLPGLQSEYGKNVVVSPWGPLEYRAEILRKQINPPFPVIGGYTYKFDKPNSISFSVKNLMIVPVTITSFEISSGDSTNIIDPGKLIYEGDRVINSSDIEISYVDEKNGIASPEVTTEYILSDELMNEIKNAESVEIYANVKISGLNQIYHVLLPQIDQLPTLATRPTTLFENAEEKLFDHPFISEIDSNTILIKSGDWLVDGDLIIPPDYEVIISPGTTLRFDEEAIFLLGNRLFSNGSEAQPVTLTSKGEKWAGMLVLSAINESTLTNTTIKNTSGLIRQGWVLTGGVTFYESPVDISYTIFRNHQGEDALNLIHSDYSLSYVTFSATPSDALDTDFSNGVITNCVFTEIGGDAIDVSGSITTVKDTRMIKIADKAVSAGEMSTVSLKDIFIDTANIGVASKDLSSVVVDTITMNNIPYAGFAAYIKKSAYGPASIEAKNITAADVNTLALVQTGNEIKINGKIMEEQDLDVDTLYSLGVLGN